MTPLSKGKAQEYRILYYLRKKGLEAQRIPLSGASQGFQGDILAPPYLIEVKRRNKPFNPFLKEWQNFLKRAFESIATKARGNFIPLVVASFKGCRVVVCRYPNENKPFLKFNGLYIQRLEDFDFKRGKR